MVDIWIISRCGHKSIQAGTYALVKENGADSESIDKIVDLIDFSEESQTYDNRSGKRLSESCVCVFPTELY